MPPRDPLRRAEASLRTAALAYPQATEDFPWGHRAIKVKGKAFLFMAMEEGVLSLSVKLPWSGMVVTAMPFAEPTGYGLGKSGWVTARFESGHAVPVDMLREWIDESYRAVAPKRLVDSLPTAEEPLAAGTPRRKHVAAAKRKAARSTRKRRG